jgi:hypothetical protein
MSPYIFIFMIMILTLMYLYTFRSNINQKSLNNIEYSNNSDLIGNKKYHITQTYVDYGNINKCNECETSLFNSAP